MLWEELLKAVKARLYAKMEERTAYTYWRAILLFNFADKPTVDDLLERTQAWKAAGIESAYAWGFITGVKNEMERQAMALMLVIPDNVKDYLNDIPNIKTQRTRAPHNVNRATYEANVAGYTDGAAALGQRKLQNRTR